MKETPQLSRRAFIKGAALSSLSLMTIMDPFSLSNFAIAARSPAQPLWPANSLKNKIVVVSDLHFGIDDKFAETVSNRALFVDFLQRLQHTTDVRELVIAGDFFDEWFVPLHYDPIVNMTKFFIQVGRNNQVVLDELNRVMNAGIKLVYVVGNHDMNMASGILSHLLPGIIEARDSKGLGRYITGDHQEVVIEHSHRYDPYSAPDRVSNIELFNSTETMYPPGYFYARMGCSWVLEGKPHIKKNYPHVSQKVGGNDVDQVEAYIYAKTLERLFGRITENSAFDEKVFNIKSCGLNGKYSLKDMYPVNQPDGIISSPVLFRNFQRSWDKRQEQNNVWQKIPFIEAGAEAETKQYFHKCAQNQYLNNDNSPYKVVIFGHTHVPDFQQDDQKFYINSGTWIDNNSDCPAFTRTFAVVETGSRNTAALYFYQKTGAIEDLSQKLKSTPPTATV